VGLIIWVMAQGWGVGEGLVVDWLMERCCRRWRLSWWFGIITAAGARCPQGWREQEGFLGRGCVALYNRARQHPFP
jgi:hypothetical protein